MDWDWGTGTAGLQPKPDKDQDWGRSEVWDCDWGRERQTVEVNGNGGTESRFGRSPDHKTHKKNDRTDKKRQETRENRLDKTGHGDVAPLVAHVLRWIGRPGLQVIIIVGKYVLDYAVLCVHCTALHCTSVHAACSSDDETPLV